MGLTIKKYQKGFFCIYKEKNSKLIFKTERRLL